MRPENELRDQLAQLDAEHQWMTDRFLKAQRAWTQDIYARALVEIGVRRSVLRWVLGDE